MNSTDNADMISASAWIKGYSYVRTNILNVLYRLYWSNKGHLWAIKCWHNGITMRWYAFASEKMQSTFTVKIALIDLMHFVKKQNFKPSKWACKFFSQILTPPIDSSSKFLQGSKAYSKCFQNGVNYVS